MAQSQFPTQETSLSQNQSHYALPRLMIKKRWPMDSKQSLSPCGAVDFLRLDSSSIEDFNSHINYHGQKVLAVDPLLN